MRVAAWRPEGRRKPCLGEWSRVPGMQRFLPQAWLMGVLVGFGLFGFGLALPAEAGETQFWLSDTAGDYEKAKLTQLAVRADGRITLAPQTEEWFDPSVSYLWAVVTNRKGQVFAGGGNPGSSTAKVFVMEAAGKGKVLAEVPGLQIQALAVDGKDRLFAATAPDSKVYLIENGKASLYFDPKVKYVWAMTFGPGGELYLGTGDGGRIFRVTGEGKGQEWVRIEDDHVRSLAADGKGGLIAGTEPSGLIVRVSAGGGTGGNAAAGAAFVLHQCERREVTAVAVAADGTIYAAATGARRGAAAAAPVPLPMAPPAAGPAPNAAAPMVSMLPVAPPQTAVSASFSGGSEVVRIDATGYPLRIWNDASEIAYALVTDREGNALVATGNRGAIYRLERGEGAVLANRIAALAPTQVTALHMAGDGKLFAATGNVGKVYRLGPELAASGTLESEVFDAGWFSQWGRMNVVYADRAMASQAKLESRSGNLERPGAMWSNWAAVGESIASPAARFLQYRMTLSRGSGSAASPEIVSTEIAYLTKNVAPIVERIEILEPNYRFPVSGSAITPSSNISIPPMRGAASAPSAAVTMRTTADPGSATLSFARGFQSARWMAGDPNGDPLRFKVELRGRGESGWKLLKDQLSSATFTFESGAFADGEYQLRVTASDALGNPVGSALTQSATSDYFQIDNTAPRVEGLTSRAENSGVVISWVASDAGSILSKVEYSVNGQEWQLAEPKSRLADANRLEYQVTVPRAAGEELTVAVRATDYPGNVSVEKINVK